MRTGNPVLNDKTFKDYTISSSHAHVDVMTIHGTINKTAIMLFLLLIPAAYVWNGFFDIGNPINPFPYVIGGSLVGLGLALVTVFKKTWAPITAPLYAIAEGFMLGGLSAVMEMQFPGIVLQAVALTFMTLFSLLAAYRSGFIQATENFKAGVTAATGGIFLVYLLTFVLSFFGVQVPYIHESGLIGIGFSLFVIVIAALNLVLDFDFIENGAAQGAPKYMEWFAAFGLMVTLIWLYIEILRLLAKLNRRD